MKAFVKLITDPTERALSWSLDEPCPIPVTLAALSNFRIPPNVREACFLYKVLKGLAGAQSKLVLMRNCERRPRGFDDDIDGVLLPLSSARIDRPFGRIAIDQLYESADEDDAVANLLQKYWQLYDGNWFFIGTNTGIELLVPMIIGEIERSCSAIELHQRLMCRFGLAACTYDDNLLDIFSKLTVDQVEAVLMYSAEISGIKVESDSS